MYIASSLCGRDPDPARFDGVLLRAGFKPKAVFQKRLIEFEREAAFVVGRGDAGEYEALKVRVGQRVAERQTEAGYDASMSCSPSHGVAPCEVASSRLLGRLVDLAELSAVRELWRWREREAIAANRPPFFVLSHETLIAIAVASTVLWFEEVRKLIKRRSNNR